MLLAQFLRLICPPLMLPCSPTQLLQASPELALLVASDKWLPNLDGLAAQELNNKRHVVVAVMAGATAAAGDAGISKCNPSVVKALFSCAHSEYASASAQTHQLPMGAGYV